MSGEIRLVFSLPPAGLRRNHEANRFTLNALKDEYSRTMMQEYVGNGYAAQYGHPRVRGPLHVEVTWRQCGEGDVDNTLSALKPLFDNLGMAPVTKAGANRYYLGVYESDSQIKRICVERQRVSKRDQERVEVIVTKLEDA